MDEKIEKEVKRVHPKKYTRLGQKFVNIEGLGLFP
jgi:hypothetical protein